MKVCPSEAFFDVELSELGLKPKADKPALTKMLIINPDSCIDCGQCVPAADKKFVEIAANWFKGKDEAAINAKKILP
jgi:NAD-dependent dihydropyrimidine dehydrogenase PreA subunit